jgi:N-acetylornithine carbamoyltransferase
MIPHFRGLSYYDRDTLAGILDMADALKAMDFREPIANGKVLINLFFNDSLRTRTSFEVAARHLGASAITITPGKGTWDLETDYGIVMDGSKPEHVKEAIQVLARYGDAIGVRAFPEFQFYDDDKNERLLTSIAGVCDKPLINLESSFQHPCQAMADWMTLRELFGHEIRKKTFVLTWAPHPRALPMAVPNSALEMAVLSGMNVKLACPEPMLLDPDHIARVKSTLLPGQQFEITHNQDQALDGADVVYAKAWSGKQVYSNPNGDLAVRRSHAHWQVTSEKMARTNEAKFMHCLPVRRNVVVSDDVLDSPNAVHIQEAENRMHAQKAILMSIWNLSL